MVVDEVNEPVDQDRGFAGSGMALREARQERDYRVGACAAWTAVGNGRAGPTGYDVRADAARGVSENEEQGAALDRRL